MLTKYGFPILGEDEVTVELINNDKILPTFSIGESPDSKDIGNKCKSLLCTMRETRTYKEYKLSWKGNQHSPTGARVDKHIILSTQHGMVNGVLVSEVQNIPIEDIFFTGPSSKWIGDYTRVSNDPSNHVMLVRLYND